MKNYKDIPGFEGKYAAAKDGKIWSHSNGHFLKPGILGRGYEFVQLGRKNTRLVHRLVAQTYIPNPENYPQVNHKNGVKTDNRVNNLEWCNNTMNMKHAIKSGLYDLKGESHPNSKLTNQKVQLIREIYSVDNPKYLLVAGLFGVSPTLIGQVVRKEIWKHLN